jgi:hypothetical protein
MPNEPPSVAGVESPFLCLVTGGRSYPHRDVVFRHLDALHRRHGNITIIHGACCDRNDPTQLTGADRWAQEWAQVRQRPYIGVPAEWARLGDKAGPIRNGRMVLYLPHGAVAFPGHVGTQNCIDQAEAAGVSVWRVG